MIGNLPGYLRRRVSRPLLVRHTWPYCGYWLIALLEQVWPAARHLGWPLMMAWVCPALQVLAAPAPPGPVELEPRPSAVVAAVLGAGVAVFFGPHPASVSTASTGARTSTGPERGNTDNSRRDWLD